MATWADLKSQGVKRFGEVGAWAYDEWKISLSLSRVSWVRCFVL